MTNRQTRKREYLEKLQSEIQAVEFETLPTYSDKFDHLLKSVYLLFEQHRETADAHASCPQSAQQRKQELERIHRELDEQLASLTQRIHDFSLQHFRIPFYHDQVIQAACAEFGLD